jgi:hypothetical protein
VNCCVSPLPTVGFAGVTAIDCSTAAVTVSTVDSSLVPRPPGKQASRSIFASSSPRCIRGLAHCSIRRMASFEESTIFGIASSPQTSLMYDSDWTGCGCGSADSEERNRVTSRVLNWSTARLQINLWTSSVAASPAGNSGHPPYLDSVPDLGCPWAKNWRMCSCSPAYQEVAEPYLSDISHAAV